MKNKQYFVFWFKIKTAVRNHTLMSLFFHYYCLHVTGGFRQFMTMKLMDNRKLATIRRIKSIRSIPGADKIVCSEIDGWTAVVKKGQFEEGFLKGTFMLR